MDLAAQMQSAQALWKELRAHLDEGLSWAIKRHLIEALVRGFHIADAELASDIAELGQAYKVTPSRRDSDR